MQIFDENLQMTIKKKNQSTKNGEGTGETSLFNNA